jgi:hypothetical protein
VSVRLTQSYFNEQPDVLTGVRQFVLRPSTGYVQQIALVYRLQRDNCSATPSSYPGVEWFVHPPECAAFVPVIETRRNHPTPCSPS